MLARQRGLASGRCWADALSEALLSSQEGAVDLRADLGSSVIVREYEAGRRQSAKHRAALLDWRLTSQVIRSVETLGQSNVGG